MAAIAFELVMVLALIVLNGVLAMAEFALVSARKARLQRAVQLGLGGAKAALELSDNPSTFLSTVQVGITLVGVLAGAFGGATIAEKLAEVLVLIPLIADYADGLALALVVLTITLLSLVIGELVPKRLALNDPERAALALARPMQLLSRLGSPLVRLLDALTNGVLLLLQVKPSGEPAVTDDEIKVLIAQAAQAGILAPAEQDMLSGVMRLGDRRIGTLITPRTQIEWLDLQDPPDVNLEKARTSRYARFPVCDGNLDNVSGVVSGRRVLGHALDGPLQLEDVLQEAVFVPESMPALQALDVLRHKQRQMLLVIDEYGGLQGLVTLADLFDSIVSDLILDSPADQGDVVLREDGSLLIDGQLPIDEFLETVQLSALPDDEVGYYETLGGLVMSRLGRIPTTGDRFDWLGLSFEVVDMDGLRVDKVLVIKTPPETTPDRASQL